MAHTVSRRWWLVIVVTALATFAANANASDLPPALPQLLRVFHGSAPNLIWLPLAYLIPFAATVPVAGRWADARGHRLVFLVGLAVFAVFSALSGLAMSLPELLLWRALSGIGGALLLPSMTFVVEARGQIGLTIWRVALLSGTVGGPVLGGVLDARFGWATLFWPYAVLAALLWVLAYVWISEPVGTRRDRRMDWKGGTALMIGLATLVVGLNVAGMKTMGPLKGTAISMHGPLGLVMVGALFVTVWAAIVMAWSQKRQARPIVDWRLLKRTPFLLGSIGTLLICVGMFSVMMFVPLFLEYQDHASVLTASLALLPATLSGLLFGVLGGVWAEKWGDRPVWLTGFALMAIGFGLLAFVLPASPLLYVYGLEALIGAGMGLPIGPTAHVALTGIPTDQVGEAAGIFNLFHNMGRPLGLGTLGALLAVGALSSYILIFAVTAAVMVVGMILIPRRRASVTPETGHRVA